MRAAMLSPGEVHPGDLLPLQEDGDGPLVAGLILTVEPVNQGVTMRVALEHPDYGLVITQFTAMPQQKLRVWR